MCSTTAKVTDRAQNQPTEAIEQEMQVDDGSTMEDNKATESIKQEEGMSADCDSSTEIQARPTRSKTKMMKMKPKPKPKRIVKEEDTKIPNTNSHLHPTIVESSSARNTTSTNTIASTSATALTKTKTVVSESECECEGDTKRSDKESPSSTSITSYSASASAREQDTNREETEGATVEEDDEDLAEVRKSIANGLPELSSQQRTQIEEEVHGVNPMGLYHETSELHVRDICLGQFQDVLERILSGSTELEPSSSNKALNSNSSSSKNTAAYELCLRKNYRHATNERGDLRLMCLRAELWDVTRACERFLKHLTALHKYFGEEGLKKPLSIEDLDLDLPSSTADQKQQQEKQQQQNQRKIEKRGVYKKGNGKGGSKRKGSLDSLPDMTALKSGSIQVLPSRDRSGRRVVILQPLPSVATPQQTQFQVQHSKFKTMLYFLCAVLRRDVDAQRRGCVLILNSTKTDEAHNEKEYGAALLDQYKELCQSIPIRFSAVHCAYNKDSNDTIPHKICMRMLQSYIENNPKTNIARVHLYDRDVSNDSTRHQISPFGIPTHQIPVTHTGTIKLKEHNGWIKIQEWYDKKCRLDPTLLSRFNIIECPGTNDVLFSQGGKYWNGVNRFQRGNLEFMEFLESKIDIYQATLSWKKKHSILTEVLSEFSQAPQSIGNPARFLETSTQIEGVSAPDGCWVQLPLSSPLLMQKIRQTLLNHIRRLESSGKRKPAPTKVQRAKSKNKTKTKKQQKQKQKRMENAERGTTKEIVVGSNKKRKIVQDSPGPLKNNKLAIATFGNSIGDSIHAGNGDYSNFQSESAFLGHKQSICEFLENAEQIMVSTAAVDMACDNFNNSDENDDEQQYSSLHDSISNDERLVQAIIANDDKLNKEIGELFEMDSYLGDGDGVVNDLERDDLTDFMVGCML